MAKKANKDIKLLAGIEQNLLLTASETAGDLPMVKKEESAEIDTILVGQLHRTSLLLALRSEWGRQFIQFICGESSEKPLEQIKAYNDVTWLQSVQPEGGEIEFLPSESSSDRVEERLDAQPPLEPKVSAHKIKADPSVTEQGSGIDLGLSKLLAEHGDGNQERTAQEDDGSEELAEKEILTSQNVHKSPVRILADQQKWEELSAACEEMSGFQDESDLEARILWSEAQVQLQSVPLSILSAPIDSVTERALRVVEEDGESGESLTLIDDTARLLSLTAKRLFENEDKKQAVSFLKKLLPFTDSTHEQLYEYACARKLEIEEKPNYKRHPQSAMELEELEELIQLSAPSSGAINAREAKGREDLECLEHPLDNETDENQSQEEPRRQWHIEFAIAASVALTLLAAWTYAKPMVSAYFGSGDTAPLGKAELTDFSPKTVIARHDRMKELGHLDALLYDIGETQRSVDSTTVNQSSAVVSEVSYVQPAGRQKKMLRGNIPLKLDGPLEPEEVRRMRQNPEYDRKEIQIVDENYVRGFPGGNPPFEGGSGTVPNGPNKDNFAQPMVYRILVDTRVMEKPSSMGTRSIARLRAGNRVEVDEKLGRWLRVRSRNGKFGYISSRDAIPYEERNRITPGGVIGDVIDQIRIP